ncbi:TMV resistance protein N-like [Neltuma alba]|uniref:TMV resistance protein N-like n=1 Tax=Neltuma alba TaxID=207710 RepID=UPI0010A3D917|nr:TMV resistance protein N-like [Prosopis alba]
MASSSSSSSSFFNDSQEKYDVFISFSGKDVRRGFLSHLVKELCRAKIRAYVDEEMKRGEQISSSLRGAIQNSQISIVIFSKNYASSSWCLDELEEIMKMKEQVVLPVFYYLDPSHVRHQRGAYKRAFAKHELKFQGNGLKVQNWRSALKNAAELSGYNMSHYRNESELIDGIVNGVSSSLNISPSESKGLVGIDEHLDCIRLFLERKSKEVQILGICGMRGIGKSTIAQVAIDKFSSHFEGSYFLENVREESQKYGLKSLRAKLISELQGEKSTFVHKRLVRRRKVFVVLDDVGSSEQLQHLVTDGIHWGPGSRFIVTSKDKQVLTAGGVHAIHEVKELGPKESLKLFSLNAFKKSHPEQGYEELSQRAVGYAKGLPLALKVVGSSLCSRDRGTWESTLRKLERYPDPQIQDVLKTSYDGLDDVLRDVFLDIAFFYKGEDKDHVIRLLDASNLFAAYGIEGLLDKALISISNDKVIQMHDLIQEMGWEIVRQECKENPGRRSRLKDFEEVYDVLKIIRELMPLKG